MKTKVFQGTLIILLKSQARILESCEWIFQFHFFFSRNKRTSMYIFSWVQFVLVVMSMVRRRQGTSEFSLLCQTLTLGRSLAFASSDSR